MPLGEIADVTVRATKRLCRGPLIWFGPFQGLTPIEHPFSACCYAVNEGYLFPTLLSASQLRRKTPPNVADVVVACFGPPSEVTRLSAEFCASENIRFILVPSAVLNGAHTMFARFFLAQLLEPQYRQLVYLDGDTQVTDSLEPLVSYAMEPGSLLATPDCMTVMIDSQRGSWPARRAHFEAIGLPSHRREAYFNSGVIRVERNDWDAISRECLKLYAARGSTFSFADQDTLNIVVGDHSRPISFRWNFPSFFMNLDVQSSINPRIYHFMSNPRPWDGTFPPWSSAWHEPYVALMASHPGLARSMQRMGQLRKLRYAVQQRVKRVMESREWGTPAVRQRIADMEARAVV